MKEKPYLIDFHTISLYRIPEKCANHEELAIKDVSDILSTMMGATPDCVFIDQEKPLNIGISTGKCLECNGSEKKELTTAGLAIVGLKFSCSVKTSLSVVNLENLIVGHFYEKQPAIKVTIEISPSKNVIKR